MKGRTIPFRKNMIQGASTVLAALVIGIFMVCTVRTLKSYDDTVTVRGLCVREVPADRVVYRVSFTDKGNSLADLRQGLGRSAALVVEKLMAAGLTESEIVTGNASIDDRYSWASDISKVVFRYSASQTVTVFTSNMEAVRQLQRTLEGDLLKADLLVNTWADYQYQGLNDIKPSMIAESLENARAAADEFAKNSHSRIGKMRTASQGIFTIDDLDENTPQVKSIRVVSTVEYYLK